MDEKLKELLQKQHYALVGKHSAVKLCRWTKKSLEDEGFCYKQQFYGIRSHLCCQMTPALGYCQNNCVYCWRIARHAIKKLDQADAPDVLFTGCVEAQQRLISGFGGTHKSNKEKWKAAYQPEHFAISLSGEPTMYPRLSEFIRVLKLKKKTSFLVSNGMLPEVLAKIEMPTQLYVSLSAPAEALFKKINQPMLADGWQRLNKSLAVLHDLRMSTRTTLRATLIKGLNMVDADKWAELVEIAQPKFLEMKAYMYVGASRENLALENMPLHNEVKGFAEEVEAVSRYKIIAEKPESRVVLMMEKDSKDRMLALQDGKILIGNGFSCCHGK
ncbi:MAG: 4-demethylwyosine synthase TYW1 [Candidatus Woesearchaeota archaeon]